MTGERNGKNVWITQRQFLAHHLTEEEGVRHLSRTELHSSLYGESQSLECNFHVDLFVLN